MTTPVPHQAIYRRWRAQTFAEIVGQEAVVETLRNGVRTGHIGHAILFVGPRGTGKTSLARILAKALNCLDLHDGDACDRCTACVSIREGTTLDLVEIDAASNRGIDAVRELRERLPYPPGELRRKVYILDEAHQITKDAWNALLKSLEEPPDFVTFMFASTEPSGFPPAILSRLQRFDVRRLTTAEIEGKLARILAADGRTADPAALHLIARLAAGGMRDAESMLDQLLTAAPDTIDEGLVRDLLGLADADAVETFVDALISGDAATGIALLDLLEDRGRDARILMDQAIEVIRGRLVATLTGSDDRMALADAARRLAAIDTDRAGVGGLRLQLELAMFATPTLVPEPRLAAVPSTPIGHAPERAAPATRPVPPSGSSPVTDTRPGTPVVRNAASAPDADSTEPAPLASLAATSSVPAARAAPKGPPARPSDTPTLDPAPGAAPPSPSSASARTADDAGGAEMVRLLVGWPGIVAAVQPAVRAIIQECRPMAIDGNIVTLGFPEAKAFLKDVAERRRPDLERAIGQFLGRDVGVRSVATNVELPGSAPRDLVAEARRIFADELADVGEIR